jgi:hypothetical protein
VIREVLHFKTKCFLLASEFGFIALAFGRCLALKILQPFPF